MDAMPGPSRLSSPVDLPVQDGTRRYKSSRKSPPIGDKDIPFGSYPPANGGTMNDTMAAFLKRREEDREHYRANNHKHTRSRSNSTVSNLLLAATERLGQETNRANELEARCGEVLSRLKTVVDEREQLRRNLATVTEELRLYKMQLDLAQKEINRAQVIVEGVDKARREAEEQAARDRTIARRLTSEKAVWIAREEGRNEGYKEGLKQGRRWANEMAKRERYVDAPTQWEFDSDGGQEYQMRPEPEPEDYSPSTPESSSLSSGDFLTQPARPVYQVARASSDSSSAPGHTTLDQAPTIPTWDSRQSRQPTKSDHYTRTNVPRSVSRPPVTESPPRSMDQVSSQRTSASRRSASQPPTRRDAPPPPRSRPLPPHPPRSSPPEVHTQNAEARPETRMSNHSRAPSLARSRRSSIVLPDGYIPTVGPGADSVISLPAPHSLSRPVSMVDDDDDEPEPGTRFFPSGFGGRATSRASTRLSDFDILQPPPRQTDTPVTHKIVREWRAANASKPNVSQPEQRQAPNAKGKQPDRSQGDSFSMRSSTTTPSQVPSRRSAATPAPVGGPRKPREIVMPMPLSANMFGPATTSSSKAPPPQEPLTSAYAYSSKRPSTAGARPIQDTVLNAPTLQAIPPPPVIDLSHQPARPKSAFSWLKRGLSRSFSATSVPNIQIEPPSNSNSGPSTGVIADAALLAADESEAPNPQLVPHPFILPDLTDALQAASSSKKSSNGNTLPRGFVPLSPILLGVTPPNGSPQPPAYTLQDSSAYTPPPGSSMHSEMGSAPASLASALLGQSGSAPTSRIAQAVQ
ncbi:hypothetical protein MIND_00003700 [Mycena indigotica]|uniref:Uncharacterized protein n=1 Tax=Mycena indigotica TaxID=2126181 RepID=A0A8H6TCP9_9AGAR|nr:uncharacterized protein MIND_00003700 [Mycena indigotica]KAF7314899.1 hypothetical protein MIND_00003700 [Mycena indigotica]